MLRVLKWVLPAVAAFALMGFATSSAKAADEKPTIKGKVVDKDGKAVADATVTLIKPRQRGQGGGGGRPEPLATATTKDDGTFVLDIDKSKVPEGSYVVNARKQGSGTARAQVKVDGDGKPDKTDVGELKLAQGGRRGGGGGGAGGQ